MQFLCTLVVHQLKPFEVELTNVNLDSPEQRDRIRHLLWKNGVLIIPGDGAGTVTRHGYRKGDYFEAVKADKTYRGWVSGDTKTQVSVSNANWKIISQFSAKKVKLIHP